MATSPYLTPAEAAEYLRMKEDRLRRLAQQGLIARIKDGAFVKFRQADLDEYMAAQLLPRVNPFETSRPKRRHLS